MHDALNSVLNEAIPRWAKLTGTKLGTNMFTWTIGGSSEFQGHLLKEYIDNLNEARGLDASGTTAILLLRGLFEAYTEECSFKAHALLYAPEKVEATLSAMREFHALIMSPVCSAAATEFKESVRAAAVHYGYDLGKLKEHLADERALGELRLAAARSREKLEVHQFLQGPADPSPLQYNREIYEFSNINSCITALHRQWISGITLALVRDANDERGACKAYFVLGLRNGQNITVLTDYEEGVHPDYHYMTRKPERQLAARARQHWFPYRLLNGAPVKRTSKKTVLVAKDARAVPVDEVSQLEPSEFLWLTLLFGLVAEKYGGDFKTEELSYTGEMVVKPLALVEGSTALVQAGAYPVLTLPKLTHETTTAEAADNRNPVGHNAWLEDRYGHLVPDIFLDVVGERQALKVGKEVVKLLPGKVKESKLPSARRQPNTLGWSPDYRVKDLSPYALDPTSFGTKAQIARNRVWSARNNKIQAVQRFAVAEFAAKHELIFNWYCARVERNMPAIWEAVVRGKFEAPTMKWMSQVDRGHPFPAHDVPVWGKENILRQEIAKNWQHAFPEDSFSDKGITLGEWDSESGWVTCYVTKQRASVFTIISPDNPKALALLAGVPEEKLPWPLRYWRTHAPYTGNSILDRVDPQDSRLDNPWCHLELRVTIALCKRALARLHKEYGLKNNEGA